MTREEGHGNSKRHETRESTMQTIRASAEMIHASAFADISASSTRCSHARSTEMERMEKLAQLINY